MPMPETMRNIARDLLNLLSPRSLATLIETAVLLIVIVVAARVTARLIAALIRRAVARRPAHPGLAPLLEGLARYTIAVTALILMLQAVHVNITALVAGAGVAGLALGFGTQYLIRDFLAGFFLLSEGVMEAGDLVRLDGDLGTVERVTLRVTQIRKFSGELLTVPNGAIGRIGNLSRGHGRAVVQITVPYRTDVGPALEVLREVVRAWAAEHAAETLEAPAVDGVVDFKDWGVVLQLSVRMRPGRQWAAEPDLRQRALEALAARGIVPEPRLPPT